MDNKEKSKLMADYLWAETLKHPKDNVSSHLYMFLDLLIEEALESLETDENMKVPMTDESYVNLMTDDAIICPLCKSYNTDGYRTECNDCGARWQDFFVPGGYHNLLDKEGNRIAHFIEDDENESTKID